MSGFFSSNNVRFFSGNHEFKTFFFPQHVFSLIRPFNCAFDIDFSERFFPSMVISFLFRRLGMMSLRASPLGVETDERFFGSSFKGQGSPLYFWVS